MRNIGKTEQSGKSLTVNVWDAMMIFVFKIAIPLIPFAAVFYLASMIMNLEITGLYRGVIPGMGSVSLNLIEDNDQLQGSLVLRQNDRYAITQGKMLDDSKMQLQLSKPSASDISGVVSDAVPSKIEKTASLPSESSIPDDLSDQQIGTIQVKEVIPEIKIEARKDQNTLIGTIEKGDKRVQFKATRNAFSSFFGKRWLARALRYFGIKTA